MRDEASRYEGSSFAAEKVVATIYAIMFVAILGMGVHNQLDRIKPGHPQPISLASTE
jgi:hypothetical protein